MGNTYWINGAQIGMIYARLDFGNPEEVRKLLQDILDNQQVTKEARKMKVVKEVKGVTE